MTTAHATAIANRTHHPPQLTLKDRQPLDPRTLRPIGQRRAHVNKPNELPESTYTRKQPYQAVACRTDEPRSK
jgi:hypothetical protein